MFGFGNKDKLIAELRKSTCQLTMDLISAKQDAKTYADMADQRMHSINAMKVTIREHEDTINNLQHSKEDLRTENKKLREGAGHALHALAAVQDLSNAFVKRLAMLPEWCGLPQNLADEVFQEFDTDLQERRKVAQEIEQQSSTLEHEATDTGILCDGDNETRNLTLPEIQGTILKEHPKLKKWLHDLKLTPDCEISELGLFKIKVDLGKNVTAEAKLWVVPEA